MMHWKGRPAISLEAMVRARPVGLPQVEAVRVLALSSIFFFHLWSVGLPSPIGQGPVGRVLSFGYLGAFLFNMISGLVLSLPHLGTAASPVPNYKEFLRRRFLRICPNYFIALMLWSSASFMERGEVDGHLLRSFLYHLLFVHTLSPETFFGIVPAFWWLGLLAQFYLVFPLVLRLFINLGGGRTLLLVCAVCWGGWMLLTRLAAGHPASPWASFNYMVYYNLPVRLPEFVMGMWLCQTSITGGNPHGDHGRRESMWSPFNPFSLRMISSGALALVVAWILLPLEAMPLFHFYQAAWCLLVFGGLLCWSPLAALGRTRPVAVLAKASYSFYLLHQPILGYAARWLGQSPGAVQLLLVLFAALVSFLLSLGLDALVSRLRCR